MTDTKDKPKTCIHCKGKGKVYDAFSRLKTYETCPMCNGKGSKSKEVVNSWNPKTDEWK